MRKLRSWLCVLLMGALLLSAAQASKILHIEAADGTILEGKLDMPEGEARRLVVFVNGSGPNTYDNTREAAGTRFNYYDIFAEHLNAAGVAFFRWSTRGCTPGEEAPLFTEVDEEAYQSYLPETSISDVNSVVRALKADERLKDCPVWLFGWSEGSMIAPHAVLEGAPADALVLCGYVNDTMMESLEWQQTGGSSMIFYLQYFDTDGDGKVSQAEIEADPYGVVAVLWGDTPFAEVDLDGDGYLSRADFALMQADGWQEIQRAIREGDDKWLKDNYPVLLTSAWFRAHEALSPNREILKEIDLPIDIFHGECDANAFVQGVRDIQAQFDELGKTNLHTHIFPDHDHDLNYAQSIYAGALSEGMEALMNHLTGE